MSMSKKDYQAIASAIWRSNFIEDKNKVKQEARQQEIANIIYDTLMHNTEPIEVYPQFDIDKVEKQTIDNDTNIISFEYENIPYQISIMEVL